MNNMLDIIAQREQEAEKVKRTNPYIRSLSDKQQLQSKKKLKQRTKFLTWGNGYKIDYSSMSEN